MIVGTAGHIDHGKSALVRALTGVETDRLKEEKARGISIDLGFAYMPMDDGAVLGFVDVPGHDRFVRNMLAGATGIDFVLLAVAADDGIMPQTREHLAILDLLGIRRGVVALTKTDLANDERIARVSNDLVLLLADTGLAGAEIFPVSSATGDGVETLRAALVAATYDATTRGEAGAFRLAVDRCFSMTGAGTIVTGSVLSGSISVGDQVMISPSGLRARIRSIHAQNQPAERGTVGQRCALNLAGDAIGKEAIARGDVVLAPELHAPADRIDAEFRLLGGEPRALAHWTPVRLHHGATEVGARIALLDESPIAPGGSGRIQLVLEQPIAAAARDNFILRDTSASRTMGGGRFIDLRAPHRRRRAPHRLAQLDALAQDDAQAALTAALDRWPHYLDFGAFARDRALAPGQAEALLAATPHATFMLGGARMLTSPATWKQLGDSAVATLTTFHAGHPQLLGLGAARLATALEPRLPVRIATPVLRALVEAGTLVSQGGALRLPGHQLGLDKRDQQLWDKITPQLSGDARFRPPRASEMAPLIREREFEVRRVLKAMAQQRRVIEIAPDHFFLRETITEVAEIVADIATQADGGLFPAARLRDRLDNGRKVSIQMLEYFDRHGLTLRRGDLRLINPTRIGQFGLAEAAG